MVVSENKKAVFWSGIDKVATYVVNFVIQIVLARLLVPDDYTVVAMLAIFFAISQAFIDSGFATALIQKNNCTEKDYSTVFYFNLLIAIVVYFILYICAPAIESFYKFPNLSLVTRVYGVVLIIGAIGLVNRVILTKELALKKIAVVGLLSSLLSSIPAIIMAYHGFGYWSLIGQAICSAIISTVLLYLFSSWTPSLTFSYKSLKRLAPFGLRILIVYIFHAVYNNIYSLLIGKKFKSADLGYYDRGKLLASTGAVGFSDFFTRALFPIQSKLQDEPSELEKSYKRSFEIAAFVVFPISCFLCIFSDSTVYTLYGSKWIFCEWILSILSIGFMLYPLQAINMNILKVINRTDLLLRSEIIKKSLGLCVIFLTINWGLQYVVIGWSVCAIIEFLISEYFCIKGSGFAINFQIKIFVKLFLIPISYCYVLNSILSFFTSNLCLQFFIGSGLFVATYLLVNHRSLKQAIRP